MEQSYVQPLVIEYLITFSGGSTLLYAAVDEEQVRRDMFDRGRLIERLEVAAESEWGKEQQRFWDAQEYREEIKQAIEKGVA